MADAPGGIRQRLESDAVLREQVLAASSRDEVVALLTAAGIDISPDDIGPRQPDGELSDSELIAAGGLTYPSCVCPPAQTMVWPLGDC